MSPIGVFPLASYVPLSLLNYPVLIYAIYGFRDFNTEGHPGKDGFFFCVCPMSWLEFRAGMCLILLRLQKSVFQKKIHVGILMGVGFFCVF